MNCAAYQIRIKFHTHRFTPTINIYKTNVKVFVVLRCANSTEEMRRGLKTYIALQEPSIRILGDMQYRFLRILIPYLISFEITVISYCNETTLTVRFLIGA